MRCRVPGRPHTAALAAAPGLLAAGVSVLDLRPTTIFAGPAVYEKWYATPHTSPELLATRTFGLPRYLCRRPSKRRRTPRCGGGHAACAGCYPTATSLGAYPAIDAGWLADGAVVIVDAISGVTGAGESADPRITAVQQVCIDYGVCKHRHTRIEQILGLPDHVVFTPRLARPSAWSALDHDISACRGSCAEH